MNKKLLKIIDDRQLVSVMNKTKWRELCCEFEEIHELGVNVRYKMITSDQLYGFSPVWWDELFRETVAIEWIDFDPKKKEHRGQLISDKEKDISNVILDIFKKHSIPYSLENDCYRVWGYLNQNVQPVFV
ncbi:DUF6678 family protein [Vibrio fluvialis]|uniref:DUF6678 family protein n=1 Tax=Vibrio fluvialis TaxID=676 RepID=UPI00301C26A7